MAEDRRQHSLDIRLLKSELRGRMKDRRAEAFAQNKNAPFELRDQFLKALSFSSGTIIGSYHAVGSEIDPAPLMEALREKGHALALPVMMGQNRPLLFKIPKAGERFSSNRYGIQEPGAEATPVEPDILLVPLLAFDRHRARLGRGSGYYDCTLHALRAKKSIFAIGLAFSCQEIPEVPIEDHDARLDRIATEIQVI